MRGWKHIGSVDAKLAECPHCRHKQLLQWEDILRHTESSCMDYEIECEECPNKFAIDVKLVTIAVKTEMR